MVPEIAQLEITAGEVALDRLPRYSGVYRFFDADGGLLYVGKSVDIHSRVLSHINEGRQRGRHQRMMRGVSRIDCTATAGEIGALLIENAAIKAETPMYNRRQRSLRKLWTIHLRAGNDGFLKPGSADFHPGGSRTTDSYGIYANKRHVENTLRRHARDHGLCLRALGLESGSGPCFQFQLRRCDGACAGQESVEDHNARLLSVLDSSRIASWAFVGPIALRERNIQPLPGQPGEQFHIINQWAYLGSVQSLQAAQEAIADARTTLFDRDAYHLVRSALRRGRVDVLDLQTGLPIDNPLLEHHQ